MILYKYASAQSATQTLMNDTLWFSIASSLNDPFETTAGIGHIHHSKFFGELNRNRLIELNYRLLCLTRDPLSPIMWSHYASQHAGMVLGVDSEMAGLEDEENCILPAQYGGIIYTRTKPIFGYGKKAITFDHTASENGFNSELLQFLQRNFLYKSSEWHYEEEVRVIKSMRSLLGILPYEIDDAYWPKSSNGAAFKIPTKSIREIYLGYRFEIFDEEQMSDIFKFITSAAPNATIYVTYPDRDSWRLVAQKVDDWRLYLQQTFSPGIIGPE